MRRSRVVASPKSSSSKRSGRSPSVCQPVADVAARLGVSAFSLYSWIKRYSVSPAQRVQQDGQADEIRHLKAELRRVSEERKDSTLSCSP